MKKIFAIVFMLVLGFQIFAESLIEAIDARDLNRVKVLVESLDADLNGRTGTKDQWVYPLTLAVQHGDVDIVRYLLIRGAKPDSISRQPSSDFYDVQQTPLQLAVGDPGMVYTLLKSRANPSVSTHGVISFDRNHDSWSDYWGTPTKTINSLDSAIAASAPNLGSYLLIKAAAPKLVLTRPPLTGPWGFRYAAFTGDLKSLKAVLASGYKPSETEVAILAHQGDQAGLAAINALNSGTSDLSSVDWKSVRVLTSYIDSFFVKNYQGDNRVFSGSAFQYGLQKLPIDRYKVISSLNDLDMFSVSEAIFGQMEGFAIFENLTETKIENAMISPKTMTFEGISQPEKFVVSTDPKNVTEGITWTSSDDSIATVSESGTVTPHGTGKATVSATSSFWSGPKLPVEVLAVPAVGLILSQNSTVLQGETRTFQLSPQIVPANSTDKVELEYSTDHPEVATVDSKGNVVGQGEGTANISVRAGKLAATANITVQPLLVVKNSLITLEGDERSTQIKWTLPSDINGTIEPADYVSDHPEIATIDANGNVSGQGEGVALITVRVGNFSATAKVTVHPLLTLERTQIVLEGDTRTSTIKWKLPSGISGRIEQPTFASDHPEIATVDARGNLTGQGEGVAQITVRASNFSAIAKVTVHPVFTKSISLSNKLIVQMADSTRVPLTLIPANSWEGIPSNQMVWNSSNPSVATIDPSGMIHTVSVGTVLITVTMGSLKTTAEVTTAYQIGKRGPAGGLVFYDKGVYSDGWRYLEAAPADVSTRYSPQWYNNKSIDMITDTRIGSGKANTLAVISVQGSDMFANQLAHSQTTGGFTDWFLPSKDELNLMYSVLAANGQGDFTQRWYWSSSQNRKGGAWIQRFANGFQNSSGVMDGAAVRAIRAF